MSKRIFILLLFIFIGKNVLGQLSFTAEVVGDVMQLGDRNTYKLKVVHTPDITIRSIDLKPLEISAQEKYLQRDTSIANDPDKRKKIEEQLKQMGISGEAMEVISWGNWKAPGKEMMLSGSESNWKSENIGEQILKTNEIEFTFWEEGGHVITPPVIEYEQNGALKRATASELEVIVQSPLSQIQQAADSVQIDPIKPILDEPIDVWKDILLPYGGALLTIFLLVGLIYFLVKRFYKKEVPPPPLVVIVPAHEVAMGKLNALEKEGLWQQGNIKDYQSQLTYIIREYLENRYEINALENTTGEIKRDLKKLNLDDGLQNELQNILQVADLVKFAKAKPGEEIHQQFMDKAKDFVRQTKQVIVETTTENKITD